MVLFFKKEQEKRLLFEKRSKNFPSVVADRRGSPSRRAVRTLETSNAIALNVGQLGIAAPACTPYNAAPLALERCQSGRSGRSRKPLSVHAFRGFESHPLRQSPDFPRSRRFAFFHGTQGKSWIFLDRASLQGNPRRSATTEGKFLLLFSKKRRFSCSFLKKRTKKLLSVCFPCEGRTSDSFFHPEKSNCDCPAPGPEPEARLSLPCRVPCADRHGRHCQASLLCRLLWELWC